MLISSISRFSCSSTERGLTIINLVIMNMDIIIKWWWWWLSLTLMHVKGLFHLGRNVRRSLDSVQTHGNRNSTEMHRIKIWMMLKWYILIYLNFSAIIGVSISFNYTCTAYDKLLKPWGFCGVRLWGPWWWDSSKETFSNRILCIQIIYT